MAGDAIRGKDILAALTKNGRLKKGRPNEEHNGEPLHCGSILWWEAENCRFNLGAAPGPQEA
jgi:hypothetical protein